MASRAGLGLSLTSVLLMSGAGSVHNATATAETRTLSFHHTHSGEDLTVTFKRNGRYDEDALKQINHFLRDWRSQDKTTMDRRLFDILWEVYRDVDGKQPINIISAYRSPATNAMLRRRSSGVARASQHMLGHAMDFYIPGVSLELVRNAGLRQQRGGVGFYPTSGSPFVHLDTGSIRHWPRLSHDQLARVFPNGRTVHVPSNGQPLSGYQLAMADIEKRGSGGDDASARSKPSLFTSLFKGGRSASETDDEEGASSTPAILVSVMATAAPATSAQVPIPRAKPGRIASYQVASADDAALSSAALQPAIDANAPPRPPMPIGASTASSDGKSQTGLQTPADIINARGFWDALPAPRQATPAQVASISARQALANALAANDPQSTSSIDASFQALAYAPPAASSTIERKPDRSVVTASAPMPRGARPASPARNPMAVNSITTVVAKGLRGYPGVAIATRLAATAQRDNDVWMRVMILAPSASTAMTASFMGEPDMTVVRAHFVKPQTAIAMTFGEDPMLGMATDSFSGAAVTRLTTLSFVTRTAALR
ncbi:MAG: hypothetical protein JWR73_2841 [Tardiphaga sp.]|nr:hypothetical protein [Tardiphaga sp.]